MRRTPPRSSPTWRWTPSSGSDATVTVPLIDALWNGAGDSPGGAHRRHHPRLWAQCLRSLAPGNGASESGGRAQPAKGWWNRTGSGSPPPTSLSTPPAPGPPSAPPAGHSSINEYEDIDASEKVKIHFARESCECCPLRWRCPVRLKRNMGVYVFKADLVKENIQRRRRARASGEFAQR